MTYGTTYEIYRNSTANSTMWGSLRLAPIMFTWIEYTAFILSLVEVWCIAGTKFEKTN